MLCNIFTNKYLSAVSCSSFLMRSTSSFFSSCIYALLWLVSPVQDSFSLIVSVSDFSHFSLSTFSSSRSYSSPCWSQILKKRRRKNAECSGALGLVMLMVFCWWAGHQMWTCSWIWSSHLDFRFLTDVWFMLWSMILKLAGAIQLLPACCDWPPLWKACSETVLWKLYWYFIHLKVNSLLYHEVTVFRENILDVFGEH